MNPLELVLGIVAIVFVTRLLRDRYRYQASVAPADSDDTARLRDEVRQLHQRIQVLERVITDNHGSVDLDREIERLRDR
jgi:hypothetical protein